jgi:hypothetical protein
MHRHLTVAIGLTLTAGLLLGAASEQQPRRQGAGVIREGFWVLNRERSRQLSPADQTLWIIKDDGHQLIWVSVSRDANQKITLNTWNGLYDGPLTPVANAPMKSKVTSHAPGTLHNEGEIVGMGTYTEECVVLAQGRRFVCHGKVRRPDSSVQPWTDDFDWKAASPP